MNNSDEAMMDTQKNIGRHALVIGGSLSKHIDYGKYRLIHFQAQGRLRVLRV